MQIDMDTINLWLTKPIWPFFRITGLFMVMPIIGANHVTARVKIALAALVTFLIAPWVSPENPPALMSWTSYLLVMREIMIGVAMGLAMQIFFQIFIMAGELAAMQMGLGFASLNDPSNNASVPVVGQFYLVMLTLVFLLMDGHLWAIQVLADSYQAIPIVSEGVLGLDIWQLVTWGGHIFSSGLQIVLPVLFALLIVNMAFGIMARAAPQLSIFAIGFPLSLCFGVTLLMLTLPTMLPHFKNLFVDLDVLIRSMLHGG